MNVLAFPPILCLTPGLIAQWDQNVFEGAFCNSCISVFLQNQGNIQNDLILFSKLPAPRGLQIKINSYFHMVFSKNE